jgi:hypothetical protein
MPDKARAVHSHKAYAVKVIVDIGLFQARSGNQHIGPVGKALVGACFHAGNVKKVPGNFPALTWKIED